MNTEKQEIGHIEQPRHAKSILTGLVVGGLVGAGTMLLFAPQPGAKTRAEVQQGATHLREQVAETMKDKIAQVKTKANEIKGDVQIKAENLQHQGKDLVAKQLDRISHVAEAGKKAIQGPQDGNLA